MARTPSSSAEKPYRLLGRELRFRLQRNGHTRDEFAEKVGLTRSHLDAILTGLRPFPVDKIPVAIPLLIVAGKEEDTLRRALTEAAPPNTSRLQLLRAFETPIQVGYFDWPPFVDCQADEANPTGLLPDLMRLFFRILEVDADWHRMSFTELLTGLTDNSVDLGVGFVLESVYRTARATFVPLHLPFAVGINAVTRHPDLASGGSFLQVMPQLKDALADPIAPVKIVVVEREIAADYLSAIVSGLRRDQVVIEKHRSIGDTIDFYTNASDRYVVFADHSSCLRKVIGNISGHLKLLFNRAIGQFQGGFLLPGGDQEWEEFFHQAFIHLLAARLPETGCILRRYARPLAALLVKDPYKTGVSLKDRAVEEFITWAEWYEAFWPKEIPPPEDWPAMPSIVAAPRARDLQQVMD
jgi:transcriptional regulator with XRE-family HTH domain